MLGEKHNSILKDLIHGEVIDLCELGDKRVIHEYAQIVLGKKDATSLDHKDHLKKNNSNTDLINEQQEEVALKKMNSMFFFTYSDIVKSKGLAKHIGKIVNTYQELSMSFSDIITYSHSRNLEYLNKARKRSHSIVKKIHNEIPNAVKEIAKYDIQIIEECDDHLLNSKDSHTRLVEYHVKMGFVLRDLSLLYCYATDLLSAAYYIRSKTKSPDDLNFDEKEIIVNEPQIKGDENVSGSWTETYKETFDLAVHRIEKLEDWKKRVLQDSYLTTLAGNLVDRNIPSLIVPASWTNFLGNKLYQFFYQDSDCPKQLSNENKMLMVKGDSFAEPSGYSNDSISLKMELDFFCNGFHFHWIKDENSDNIFRQKYGHHKDLDTTDEHFWQLIKKGDKHLKRDEMKHYVCFYNQKYGKYLRVNQDKNICLADGIVGHDMLFRVL